MRTCHKFLILFLFLLGSLHADWGCMPELRSVALIGDPDLVGEIDLSKAKGLKFYGIEIPGGEARLKAQLEPLFMGRALNQQLIDCLKQEIVIHYRNHYRPIVAVYVPEQDVSDGVLQLLVIEGLLGKVAVKDNRWFTTRSYERKILLNPGEPIRSDRLLKDMAWINRNPFRSVDAIFTPGAEPGTTDINLIACDRFPLSVYVGGDNTGNDVTGHARWYTGFTWGDAFWLNHMLTYQYTTGSDPRHFQSHNFHYTAFFPWQHLLRIYGGYAIVHPPMTDFHSKGTTFQSSLRYTIPYGNTFCGRLREFTLGFDFKNYNNNLIFIGDEEVPLITQTINLTQFVLGYHFGMEDERKKLSFALTGYWSPGKMLPNQTDARYNELSPNAKVRYIYGDATIATTWFLPHKYEFFLQGRGQISNQVLLPSEQFGLGGYDTVRGYEENEFLADDAFCLNVELHSRPFSLLRYFNSCTREDAMYFLLFFDYGIGHLINSKETILYANDNPTIPTSQYLMGVGPGLRYTIGRYLSARADWGIRLHHNIFSNGARSMFHLGLVLSY